jgi:hypothetical protein
MSEAAKGMEPFWAVVEIFGHESLAGQVSEGKIGSVCLVRVDVPAAGDQPAFTKFYGEKAIYSITPVSEELARQAVERMRVRPINVYLLVQPPTEPNDDGDSDEWGG